MQHGLEVLLFRAKDRKQRLDTEGGDKQKTANCLKVVALTNPIDLTTRVHKPMKRRMTKPPRTVLISGMPLCLA